MYIKAHKVAQCICMSLFIVSVISFFSHCFDVKFLGTTRCVNAPSIPVHSSNPQLFVMSKKEEFADIDAKTNAVFHKKGYQLMGKLGAGAFGQVRNALLFSVLFVQSSTK